MGSCLACRVWAVLRPVTCWAVTWRCHLPYYLINGRIPGAASTFTAKPGQYSDRIINAGADTAFRVALAGTG